MSDRIVTVESLIKKYGDLTAVNGLSFEVEEGEIFGLLGPNGAGKTTTLEIMETLRSKTSGNVFIDGMDIDECQKVLNSVGLSDRGKSKYKELSGGQKQRFSIATTLINEPRLVFLDEPTTGLDPQARRNLWKLIRKIRDEGATVIMTTHYMEEAEELCDRVGIINEGAIISLDSPDNLIDQLVASGFERNKEVKSANLEDVFISLTGHEWKDE